ncbi:hypothetical protein LXA43DRAFT_1176751 [Ganoderma leucocontextum]|nr:hypothetical protein LXA43DRAFT_1176751 [Ganoderma leucocontextum]
MDHHPPFPFARLPEEIQMCILLNLEAPDILRFREVSKAFSKLASATAIEYKVQLDIAGMVDNPHHGSPLIERYMKLLQYQDGWKNTVLNIDSNVSAPIAIDIGFGLSWEWAGGVFPYVVHSRSSESQQTLHLYRLGSSLREVKSNEWIVGPDGLPDGYRMLGCGTDMAQDLLVLSLAPWPYNLENDDRVCILQLLSLRRTDVPHPLASSHILRGQRLLTDEPQTRSVRICEDVVAYAIYNYDWEIEVWNWKTGTLLLRHRSILFHGFALLNESYLLTLTPQSEGLLAVYCIYSSDPALNSGAKIRRSGDADLVLELMPFTNGAGCLTWLSHSPETTSADDIPPFNYDPDLSIFALYFKVHYVENPQLPVHSMRAESFLLIASVPEVIRNLDRLRASADADVSEPFTVGGDPPVLEWDEWGPSSTRLVAFKSLMRNTAPAVSRTRCAVVVRGPLRDDRFDHILLLSAHRHAALGACTTEGDDGDAEDAAALVTYEDTITRPNVFRTPVHTTLPINVTCRKIPKHEAPDVEVGLFEDGLSVMYTDDGDDSVMSMDEGDTTPVELLMFCV